MGRLAGSNRHMAWPPTALALVVLALLAVAATVDARSQPGRGDSAVRVRVVGLPPGANPMVVLRAADGTRTSVRRSGEVRGLRPGTYAVHVLPVHLRTVQAKRLRGGVAYPAHPSSSLVVRAGAVNRMTVLYGTIETAAAHLLRAAPLAVGGDPANPKWVKLSSATWVQRGTILVSEPTQSLPDGLFHLVTHLRPAGGATLLSLRPAKVTEVYPEFYLDGQLPLAGPSQAGGGANGVPSLWSISDDAPGCAERETGYANTIDLRPTLTAKRFYFHRGTASGSLITGLSGSVNLEVPAGASSTCTASPTTSSWRGFLPMVGTVPIPYYVQPSFQANWQASGSFTLQASGSLSIVAGLRFGPQGMHPTFSGHSDLTTSLSHESDVDATGGFGARWGLGLPQSTLAYVQVSPGAYGKSSPCVAGGQVVVKGGLRRASVSHSYDLASQHCPQHTLTVASAGSGIGSMTSNPGGIGCSSSCSVQLDEGTQVTVTAAPASGSSFAGWSGGGCSGTGPCTMTLSQDSTVTATFSSDDPSAPARHQLVTLLQNVTQANGVAKEPTDGTGHTVDTIKILSSPDGGYLGVYHALVNGAFQVRLATSSNLLRWTYVVKLDQNASQPALAQLSDGSFLLVDEKSLPNGTSHLHFADYANLAALKASTPAASYDAPLTLSTSHEGTPDIRTATLNAGVSSSQIQIGLHYYDPLAGGDRDALGTLINFTTWSAQPDHILNNSFSPMPAEVGDRSYFNFEGYPFTVVEAQMVAGDWTTWHVFLYDETAGILTPLNVVTPGGSRSFANPAVNTLTDPAGNPALVVSYFLPYQGAAPGEAGPLVFYSEY